MFAWSCKRGIRRKKRKRDKRLEHFSEKNDKNALLQNIKRGHKTCRNCAKSKFRDMNKKTENVYGVLQLADCFIRTLNINCYMNKIAFETKLYM